MSTQQKIIQSKKVGVINEFSSVEIPNDTENIYFSYHDRWDGNLDSWTTINDVKKDGTNYDEQKSIYILNYTGNDITIVYEKMDDVTCYSNSNCINVPVVVDFVPIPISFVPNDDNQNSNNPYDNYTGNGTGWIGGSSSGIGWSGSTSNDWWSSGYGSGGGGGGGYSGHANWSGASTDDDPIQEIVSIIRQKNACTVDDAMLEVHMYNGIYSGFTVRYRYAVVDLYDDIHISSYKTKHINSIDIYILDYGIRAIDATLTLDSIKVASIEVEIIPDANYSRSSFVSVFDEPIIVTPYSQGIIPHLTLNGDDVIFINDGDDQYQDQGADYWDEGFPIAPHVTVMSTGFTNNVNSITMEYQVCGSSMLTREVFDGKINNDGDELVFKQGLYSYIRYTEVDYIVKLKDNIVFNYDHYQILLIDDNDSVLHTYPLDTEVTSNIELLSETRRYTVKFFIGQVELELINDVSISDNPKELPYTYSTSATIENDANGFIGNEHQLIYDTENYTIRFNNFIETIQIVPISGLSIPLNIDHYITSKQIIIKDENSNVIGSETLTNPLLSFDVDLQLEVKDNSLNMNILTIDLVLINKNQLPYTSEIIIAIYEKYLAPTSTLRVLSDGSDVELRTMRDSSYSVSGDSTNRYIEHIGGKNELMIDIDSYKTNIMTIEEDGVVIMNHNTNGSYSIIKDKNNFTIWDKPSPVLFFMTDGFSVEAGTVPIVLLNRNVTYNLKILLSTINGSSNLSSLELVVTNILTNDNYTFQGNTTLKSFSVLLDNKIETGAILCFEAKAILENGRNNTIKMVGKVV